MKQLNTQLWTNTVDGGIEILEVCYKGLTGVAPSPDELEDILDPILP